MINERDGEQPRTATAEVKKWNLVIDVANCTNCNLCTLAVQDEYVGNEFPGYAAEMPRHGHRWINIHTRERGRAPMVDVALSAFIVFFTFMALSAMHVATDQQQGINNYIWN